MNMSLDQKFAKRFDPLTHKYLLLVLTYDEGKGEDRLTGDAAFYTHFSRYGFRLLSLWPTVKPIMIDEGGALGPLFGGGEHTLCHSGWFIKTL